MQPRGDRPIIAIFNFRLQHLTGWVVTFVLCLIPALFWLHLHPLNTIDSFPEVMLNLGRLLGLVGMVLYALDLVYATRLRFLEYCFGGLNRVYIAHHIIGGVAFFCLGLHPFFLLLQYARVSLWQGLMLLLPHSLTPLSALFDTTNPLHTVVQHQWALLMGIVSFLGLTILLLITFFVLIPYRIWLQTHKLLGVFFFVAGFHVLLATSDTSISMPLRAYMLSLVVVGIVAWLYRQVAGHILVRYYQYQVVETVLPAPGIVQIRLLPLKQAMSYKPGQFLFVRFTGVEPAGINPEWHPFSISSSPKDEYLELTVKGLGDYTNKLGSLPRGTVAEIEGAYGTFSTSEYSNPVQIWVAGGIGITPFLSMAKSIPDLDIDVTLYYSVRTASEIIDWQRLYDIAMLKRQFHVFPYIVDQQPGHLNVDYIEQTSGPVDGKEVYICGPPAMMKSLKRQFRARRVPAKHIHTEEFTMS